MYNADLPNRAALPTSRQLIRSTLMALVTAIAILVTLVLPAEYGVDPTGIGKALGLTKMGNIKVQLADEAETDLEQHQDNAVPLDLDELDQSSGLLNQLLAPLTVRSAHAEAASEEVSFTLNPAQGIEIKLIMTEGAEADFAWDVEGGVVNYDLHGDGDGNEISYQKDRGVDGHEGVLTAAFDGQHGWFWRNRGDEPITINLSVSGDYSDVKAYK